MVQALGVDIAIIYRGMNLLRLVENWAAPFVLVMTAALVAWAYDAADGMGPLLAQKSRFADFGSFWKVFVPSLTGMVGFWATLSLNMPDFTRFGRSQREQAIGQTVALPTTMFVFAAMGVFITSATAVIYGQPIWDPIHLVAKFDSPVVIAISMFTVVVATLSVNIAANVVSPANDFANAFPRFISFSKKHQNMSWRVFSRSSLARILSTRARASNSGGLSAFPLLKKKMGFP